MVTQNPARALRMGEVIGALEIGKWADILVVKQRDEDPFETLLKSNLEDIELLVLAGVPILASDRFIALFQRKEKDYTSIAMKGHRRKVIGDPNSLLKRVRTQVGYQKVLDYMPLQI